MLWHVAHIESKRANMFFLLRDEIIGWGCGGNPRCTVWYVHGIRVFL